jgi:hypothetical protein
MVQVHGSPLDDVEKSPFVCLFTPLPRKDLPAAAPPCTSEKLESVMQRTVLLSAFGLLSGLATGYHIGGARTASVAVRYMRGGAAAHMSVATPPADAVSMKAAGLCEKLTVPSDLLDKTDVFIFDCDGVIWKGDSLIDGVPAILKMLREAGKRIFFVTNNSTKSRKGYLGKFRGLGLDGVEAEEIFSSSFAAAAYLEKTNFKASGKKVYIVGEVGIAEELDLIGVPWCVTPPPSSPPCVPPPHARAAPPTRGRIAHRPRSLVRALIAH